MHLHEFQAKQILQKAGVPVTEGFVVQSIEETEAVLKKTGRKEGVVKVQVHAGGRGKAGGVKLAKTPQEILEAVKVLLHKKIVNQQTGPEGMVSHFVLIDEKVSIDKEYYLGAIIDRKNGQALLMASPEGGMDIEEIAAKKPDKLVKIPIQLDGSIRTYHWIKLAKCMGWPFDVKGEACKLVKGFAKAFMESDASLLEINPLVSTKEGKLLALDAKMTVDDNALFRQPLIASFFDPSQQPVREVKAHEQELAYVSMDGEIGCMVNGAGLAMATMDIINFYGGKPANFLDVGGSADEHKVTAGFQIILSDPNVKAILVNIFGGIMNCQTIALGIIAALKIEPIQVPLVVRLEGTDVEKGKALLDQSGLKIIVAHSLEEAAQKVVNCGHSH